MYHGGVLLQSIQQHLHIKDGALCHLVAGNDTAAFSTMSERFIF